MFTLNLLAASMLEVTEADSYFLNSQFSHSGNVTTMADDELNAK